MLEFTQLDLNTWVEPSLVGSGSVGIYAIYDPRNHQAKYIGKSTLGIVERWRIHHKELQRNGHYNQRLQRLHSKLQRLNLGQLECRTVEYCSREALSDREVWWIAEAKRIGLDLCNSTNGGGLLGKPCSEETRRKLREAHLGKPHYFPPEVLIGFIEKQKSRIPTEKQLAALARGRTDPEIVARNRKSVIEAGRRRKGTPKSKQAIDAMRATHSKLTEEIVTKVREVYWQTPEIVRRGIVKALAKKYNVALSTMYGVVVGASWKTVPMPMEAVKC